MDSRITFPVGPIDYTVELVVGYIDSPGGKAIGLSDPDKLWIGISDQAAISLRIATFWHEIAHCWKADLDPTECSDMDEESWCRLIALGMSRVNVGRIQDVYEMLKNH